MIIRHPGRPAFNKGNLLNNKKCFENSFQLTNQLCPAMWQKKDGKLAKSILLPGALYNVNFQNAKAHSLWQKQEQAFVFHALSRTRNTE